MSLESLFDGTSEQADENGTSVVKINGIYSHQLGNKNVSFK